MEDIEFLYLDNGNIKQIKFQDIAANGRVLICSLTRPYDNISDLYVQYIHSKVNDLHIDKVYFINCITGKTLLHSYHAREGITIPLLYNSDKTFIAHLKQLRNITNRDVNFLASYWNFQALFENGKLVHFADSSIDNPIKDAIKADPGFVKERGYHLINEDPNLVLWIPSLLFFSRSERLVKLIFYKNVWPNESLDKYLLDLQTTTAL
jgi:hypothetical protein